jgi:hypothetical protein
LENEFILFAAKASRTLEVIMDDSQKTIFENYPKVHGDTFHYAPGEPMARKIDGIFKQAPSGAFFIA